jgi:TnpA family transposase
MTAIERTAYPRFKQSFTEQELATFYTPTEEEIAFVNETASGKLQRLTLMTLLKSFQKLGYLPQWTQIPEAIKEHIAFHAGGAPRRKLSKVASTTRSRYRQAIRAYLHIRPYRQGGAQVVTSIVHQVAETMSDPADLINVAVEELIRQQYELPAYRHLDEFVNHLRHEVHAEVYARVMATVTDEQKVALDNLLTRQEGASRYPFNLLKSLPKSTSLKEVRRWEEHLVWLEGLIDPAPLLDGLTNTKIEQFASEAQRLETGDMQDIKTPGRRYTLLLCMLHQMQVRTRDQLATMYLKRMRLSHNNAKQRLRDIRDKHRSLSEMMVEAFAEIVNRVEETDRLDEEQNKDALLGKQIRQMIAAKGGTQKLKAECEKLQAYHNNNYLPLLQPIHRKHRSISFRLTEQLHIWPATQSKAVLQALDFVRAHRRKQNERLHLEACIFTYIAEGLRSGDLYVVGSETYANYRTQLLPWAECEPLLAAYCQVVGLPTTAISFVRFLQDRLAALSRQIDATLTEESDLSIDAAGKPHLRSLARQPIPETAEEIQLALQARMPERHLLDILHATHHWASYSRHFGPPSGADPKLSEPVPRYLLTIFGYGCNLGPTQTARHTRSLATARVLGRINAQHITSERLDAAIRDVVDEYAHFRLPFLWGTGRSSIADGTHYELYENNLLGERHIRYGGYGGIAFHHISDTYVALFSHFIACGVWEAVYILDGLLKNKSVLQPDAVHTDTQGQSEVVFGLSHLLGIKLMPRMRNWNKVAMYRPDANITYSHIDSWFTRTVDWGLIGVHWRHMMQVVLSIYRGKVLPSWLLQKLRTDNPKNKLFLAFRELGRVVRTLFLLEFATDSALRQQIRAATNKIEAYHSFSEWIFFGGDSVLKSRDPVEYEKRIKYKDLIANAIMLQNVVDMTNVLHDLARDGYIITPEIVATFSPYLTEHIKRFGEYVIDVETIPPPLQPDKPFLTPEVA